MANAGYLVPVGALYQALTDQGVIGSGFKINTYVGGTVSTPLTTFTDATLTVQNSNPIILGSNGRFQNVNIWVPAGTFTKLVLTDANNNLIAGGTIDNLPAINDISSFAFFAQTALEISAGVTPTNFNYPAGNWLRYGADPSGVADSTTAINNSLKGSHVSYGPAGTYSVTNALVIQYTDQVVMGDNMNTTISVTSGFNLSAAGVFNGNGVGTPDHGPWFIGLHLTCDQSQVASSGTRANLRLYPPAFFLRGSQRWRIVRCRVEFFTYGIDSQGGGSTGATSGAVIQDLEIGCFSCQLAIDGSGDTYRIHNMHVISFNGWSTNQRAIMADGNTIGISSGMNGSTVVVDSLFFSCGKALNAFLGNGNNQVTDPVTGQSLASNGGTPWLSGFSILQYEGCGFDTNGGIYFNCVGGWALLSGCYFSATVSTATAVNLTGGELHLDNCRFNVSGGPPNPFVSVSNAGSQPVLFSLHGCMWQSTLDQTLVLIAGTVPIYATIDDNKFLLPGGTSPTNPIVSSTNTSPASQLTFAGNTFTQKNAGTGTALSITTDGDHHVNDNEFTGWSITMPAAYTKASVSNNTPRGTVGFNAANADPLFCTNGNAVIPANTTVYLGPGAFQAAAATSNAFLFNAAGNITAFKVQTDNSPGGATTFTYKLYKNGVATSMTGSITAAGQTLTVTTNGFAVAAGDFITMQVVTAAGANTANHLIGIVYEPA